MHRPRATLLNCGIDIRRLIYDYLFVPGQDTYLTYLLDAKQPPLRSTDCKPRPTSTNLLLTCQQLYHEIAPLVYGKHRFFLTPRETNANCALGRYPSSNSDMWLERMRPSTKRMVGKLMVSLKCPREADIQTIADGLAGFPTVEIKLVGLGAMDVRTRLQQRELLGSLCRRIAEKRVGGRTVWDNSGDIENAAVFQNYLPGGFAKRGRSQYEKLEDEEAWR